MVHYSFVQLDWSPVRRCIDQEHSWWWWGVASLARNNAYIMGKFNMKRHQNWDHIKYSNFPCAGQTFLKNDVKSHIITDEGSDVTENGGFPALLLLFKYTFPFVLSFGFQGVDEAGRYILPFGTSLPSVSAVCARLVSIFIVGLLVACVFTRFLLWG